MDCGMQGDGDGWVIAGEKGAGQRPLARSRCSNRGLDGGDDATLGGTETRFQTTREDR